jgi:hypothetical protein
MSFFVTRHLVINECGTNDSNRVDLANKLVVKRLVMERILYSEIGALQSRYLELFGVTVRPDQLDSQVFNDIAATLNLVNTLIPSIIRGSYVCFTSV